MARSHRFTTPSFLGRTNGRIITAIAAIPCFAFADARGQTLLWKAGTSVVDLDRMGDFDGDRVGDVVIADGGTSASPVVISGKDGSVLATFTQTPGSTIAGIGDQNGDGVPDLLFGNPAAVDLQGNVVGHVTGISGATGKSFYDYTGREVLGLGPELASGICVRAMGDANGDGLPDFAFAILSEPSLFGIGPTKIMERWNGGKSGVDVLLTWEFDYQIVPAHALTSLGDIDAAGASDFAASYNDFGSGIGSVEIHSGKSGSLIRTIPGAVKSDAFGRALGSCGDQDGDGLRELLVGAPGKVVAGGA